MSILVDQNTRLLVQGITGKEGSYHAARCREYGTNLVAGVTPGKGGQLFDGDVPVYDTVERAVDETGANASLIFVPPPFAADAIVESVDAGIPVIATITEGVPVKDSVNVVRYLQGKDVTAIGPNCPGVISPAAKCKMGIMPGSIHAPGRVGIVSRSGTLTYEAVGQLTGLGIGQSTSVGIGGDPVNGTSFVDVLELFNDDPETRLRNIHRRDRRHQRAGGRRVHRKLGVQQGSRSPDRRKERSARSPHGTRGRDHHR